MPKVYIERKGIWVNFPDTMGEDQIRAGIGGILSGDVAIPQGSPEPQPVAREIPSTPPPEPSFLQKVGKTLSGINLGTGEEALYDNKGSLEGFEDLTGIDLKRMAGSDIRAAQAMGADALKGLRQGAAAATQATYAAARSPFEWLLGGIEEATRPKVDRSGPMSAFTREQVEQDQAPDAGLINKVVSFPLRSLRGGEDMYAQMTELPDLAKQFISNTGSMLGALAYVGPSVGIGRQAWSMVPDKLARPFFRRLGAGLTAATVANKLDVTDEHFPETAALFMLFEGAPDTGAAAKRVGRAAYEKATRRTIEEEGAPREVFVSAEKVKDIFQTGEKISPEEGEMVRALGLKASQYKAAIDRGLHIRIPAEKIITYGDRPWVQVVKKAFGKDPYIEVRKVGEAPSFEYGPKIVKPRTVKEKPAEPPRQDIREVSPESKIAPEMPQDEIIQAAVPPVPETQQGVEGRGPTVSPAIGGRPLANEMFWEGNGAVHGVAMAPSGNYAIYKYHSPNKVGGRFGKGHKLVAAKFFDTQQEAAEALAEYAQEKGWNPLGLDEFSGRTKEAKTRSKSIRQDLRGKMMPPEMQLDGVIETGRGTISDEGINAIQAVRDRWVNEGKGPTPEEIHQYPFLEDVFKGQKPGKSDYVPPQELAGAARAIDQARISQRTSPGTARLAQHLLTLDPTFDQNSTLEISDAVHKATPDIIKREGLDPEGEYAILGKTVSHIEDAATRTAISLYKGHDADTLVEEWYHRAYDRLNPKDRAAYDAYHKKTGDTRSPNEHFAQEGRDFFFSDKLHEAAGGIRRIFEGAREALKALIKRVRDLRGAKIPKKIQEMYRRAGRKSGEPLRNSNEYEPDPGDSGLTETSYQIRLFNEGKDVDCKPITNALMKGKKIGAQQINAWLKAARAAGVSKKGIDRAVRTFIKYNKMKDEGPIAWLPVPVDSVVLREGVLNTPAVEGVRRERLDNLYQDINIGSRSSATGALFEGGEERTGIPKEVRGLVPQPFLNIPITQPRLQTAPPSGHKYPLVVTGNPHVDNFRRPHKGWDNHIKVVRVKPVLGGNAKVTKAVTDAIRYAQDIGARVLITTFRAKQPWILAKYTSFLPTDPNDPNFSTFWKENPNPKPSDPKKLPDWTPYVPRNQKVADAFRANGWDIEKNIYGTGGTWWWPKSKELDPEVQKAIGKTELEYCDLMHQGCPSCRNCQKLTYPDAAGAPIIGVTDEPFCEHGCPQCFVRLGQSGVGGRGGISLGQNAKQAGFGKPDLGDIYKQTVSILQGIVRPAGSRKVDYVSKFMHGTPADKMDAAMSLFIDGEITPYEFNTIREEIGNEVGSIADQILPEERVSYQLRKSESPWYSQLERVVESPKFPNRAPGAQIAQALESWAKNGEIKQEELDWSGVIDWLKAQGPKVSKEQVLDYLRQNNVQIQEVMKGEDIQELPKEWEVIRDKIVETGEPFWSVVTETGETYEMGKTREQAIENALKSLNRHSEGRTETRYSSYQLPGGENYRELLLTLGREPETDFQWAERMRAEQGDAFATEDEMQRYRDDPYFLAANRKEMGVDHDQYHSSHWNEPNVLAHIRFNERTDAEGKRVLFLEEIQSDWHQEGRKKGYRETFEKWKDRYEKEVPEVAGAIPEDSLRKRYQQYLENAQRAPDAPFKKTWPMLAFKRMVRYAAENGYDRIAWTTGEQQAERYDLSKQLKEVAVNQITKENRKMQAQAIGEYNVEGILSDGRVHNFGSFAAEELPNVVGKELAQKIIDGEGRKSEARIVGGIQGAHIFEGLDLKVGGEGMKGFYDKILPSEVNKFFGKGKWGNAKVGDTKIITKPEVKSRPVEGQPGLVYEGLPAEIVPVHSLDITPEMKQKALAEGMPYYQARKINKDQADLDAGARDARRVADQQLGKKPQDIDKGFFEGITDLKPIRDLLHELGIKDKYDGITLTNKDYVDVYKYLQMPADVKISHPEFGPLYDRQRERELSKAILDHAFAKKTEPYFKGMDDADRIKVDAALIQGEQEGVSFYDPLQLKERFGLNEKQIAGYTAIRDSLDAAGEMLLWEMEQSGVKPEALEEFKTRLAGYVPHKWYGNWAIIVRKKGGKKTKFMTKTNFLDRYTERDRVQALYPNDEVFVMQSKKIPYEAYQDAAPWAVSKMVDLVIDKAEVSPAMADELKQALGDLYKSKGFGAHFIKRKGTPGWTEDLAKPLAEYFAGLNGYMTKMRAIKGFAEDIQAIDPKKKPNLYRYALDYIRYVTGEPFEFAGAKQAAYIYYLYANIKSAAVNLTQNMLLGWPVLAKHTRLAGAKLLQAQVRAANRHMLTDGEKAFLEEMESLGYLDPKMAVEMGAFTANPLLRQIPQGVKDFGEFIDIFQHMEAWNRRAMAVALYDSGIREPMRAAELIEEAHFRYSKGNRPELMRGIISPIMTFRSWMINYVTWLKNEIKAGRLAPVARSLAAMVLLGGFAGLPFFKLLKKLWVKMFGEDPQTAAAKHIGQSWATLIFRGLPSKLGISFTGSIGLGDILPTDLEGVGGVFADVPGRVARVSRDLSARDYVRALEDASPEAIRQPMAAYRSSTKGDTTRSGAPIYDPTTGEQGRLTRGEAVVKSLGFQPIRSAERWDLQETVQQIQDARAAKKQEWANRYVVAMRAGDKKEVARVVRDINEYNKKMKAAGRVEDMITKQEILSAVQSRRKAGVPPKYLRPKWRKLLEGRGISPNQ